MTGTGTPPRDPASPASGVPGPGPGGPPGAEARRGLLDPGDWEAFRATFHRVVDQMTDRMRDAGAGPVWREIPDEVRDTLRAAPPREGRGVDAVLEEVHGSILPYALGNTHPRFFGWVHGTGTPAGAMAEAIAGTMNANVGGRLHSPVLVEEQVVRWVRDLFDFPEEASGLLVSGTSMATIVGLAVARHGATGGDARARGMRELDSLVGYTSEEGHQSIRDAFALLGLGSDALRPVPTRADGDMDPAALEARIREDRETGHLPFAVVATAGSVTCGAIDDLREIRRIANRHGLWVHVDAAFGAAARLAPALAPRLAGIEEADSIAFDFHKWFHVPYDAGAILVRDGELHRATFGGREDYLTSLPDGPASGEVWPCDLGPELSRGFRAFKVWFALQALGTDAIGAAVERNCRQARRLAERVDRDPRLERLAPADLNIVTFRYRPREGDGGPREGAELNRLNRGILLALHRRGIAVPSPVRRDEAFGIRICLCNHRTRDADLEWLLDAAIEIGEELVGRG